MTAGLGLQIEQGQIADLLEDIGRLSVVFNTLPKHLQVEARAIMAGDPADLIEVVEGEDEVSLRPAPRVLAFVANLRAQVGR